ncbi:hypothetical protein COLSTE_00811 [Collinsella stercoris DSM 13279]|uniref:Uncharacterized protein n=1 Tax=Collinsella stercoris DSM 13279 TaxID=445975 RepID=B6G9S0_9ACTN|nr:hypothetical protein COLSTE_00811 [Collinsella stercoris DSM 13279]
MIRRAVGFRGCEGAVWARAVAAARLRLAPARPNCPLLWPPGQIDFSTNALKE